MPGGEQPVPGWKWRHESPSPELESLTPLNTLDMDFSTSEVDALEAILPPTPPYWQQSFDPSDPRLKDEPSPLFSNVPYARIPLASLADEPKTMPSGAGALLLRYRISVDGDASGKPK